MAYAYLRLGDGYRDNANPAKAVGAYKQSLKLDPSKLDAWEGSGLAYLELKQNFAAFLAFNAYLAHARNNASVWCNLGICWRNMGCLTAAMNCYRHALRLNPKLTAARFNLCLIYLRLHMFGDAIGEYLKLQHQAPELARQLEPIIVSK